MPGAVLPPDHRSPRELFGHYLRDLVYGANDGIITTFAVVCGVAGADLSTRIVLILGFANLLADGFSMGASNYLSIQSETAARAAAGQKARERHPLRHGMATFLAFIAAGFVPLVAYIFPLGGWRILDRRAEEEILPTAAQHGISIIARGPVASGLLTESKPVDKGYLDYSAEEIVRLRERLQSLVTPQRSLAQLAIRFALSEPAVATVIPGASSLEQLEHNLDAAALPPLSEDELALIRRVSRANQYTAHR